MNKISDSNKIKFYDYIVNYEKTIYLNFGHYDIKHKSVLNFCNDNRILIGSDCKFNDKRIPEYKYFLLWDDKKPTKFKNYQENDSAHNLFRHIRNSMAHGNIKSENRQKFLIEDFNSGNR